MSKAETRPKAKPAGSSLLRRIYAFFCSAEPRKTSPDDSPIGSPASVPKDELRPPMLPIPKQYFQQLLQERPAPYSLALPRESPIGGFSSEVNRPLMSLPIDPSMLTWTQSVRRLNTEYRLTVTALEQVKDFIQSTTTKEVSSVPMTNVFARPRLVQRMDLNRFPVLAIIENDENDQPSAESSTTEVRPVESESEDKPDCTLETITNLQEQDPSGDDDDDETEEEETTYTVETFYGKANDLFSNHRQVVIVREEATEEQFNAVQEKSSSSASSTKPKETSSSSINDQSIVSPPLTSSESPAVDKTKKTLGTKVSQSTSTEKKPVPKKPVPITRGISTERAHLLRWCQQQLSDYPVSDRPLTSRGEKVIFRLECLGDESVVVVVRWFGSVCVSSSFLSFVLRFPEAHLEQSKEELSARLSHGERSTGHACFTRSK